ncbi:MAG: hypothetical protein OHK0046_17580 [Anaerolineae bacterium]
MTQLTEQLTDLLRRTGAAHGVYETNELNGVYDEDWPAWYAAWALENGLNDLLGTGLEAEALASLLVEINNAHRQADTNQSWAQFTAAWLVEKYQS